MRIIAGELRGREIVAPHGQEARPTIDRVREALFSTLYSLRGGFEGAIVLDAFAGSGALSIEAISRGASRVVVFERNRKVAAVCARNLSSCGIEAEVNQRDVLSFPPITQNPPFDLVFLDPPYAYEARDILNMVATLRKAGALTDEAIIVYEHDIKNKNTVNEAATLVELSVKASKRYGNIGITLLKERV